MKMSWAIILAASVGFGTPGLAGAVPAAPINGASIKAYRTASLLWSGPRGLLRHEMPARSSDGIIAVRDSYDHQTKCPPGCEGEYEGEYEGL